MEIPKKYDAELSERKWRKFWGEKNLYKCDFSEASFTIDTPPPTVSGRMHIGHACSYSQGDFIARYKRLTEGKVFYPFGTDDNGLPTERLVEKEKKVRAMAMSKKEFRELCYSTIKELKPDFVRDWKVLGISCDFSDSYSTISPECQKVSQLSFIDLYEKGLVERKKAPVAWCPKCMTAIAQAEFENLELKSSFNDVAFSCEGKDLVISTTRPELIPACVALFANPSDGRYKDLKGKKAKVPLFDYEVPILFDESVAIDKGTGLMMVCTFGDKEDIEKWNKYGLDLRIIFTREGKLNGLSGKYEGMKIKEAREEIIKDLEAGGFLSGRKEIEHAVNTHERCNTEIEFLIEKQWYVKILENKERLVKAADDIEWHPEFMKKRYVHWVENLGWDWCISRQRHFGIPFPVWYCRECGKEKLAEISQLPVDPLSAVPLSECGCGSSEFIPEEDVMDTWATSSLTPQIAMKWSEKEEDKERFEKSFPMSLRLQAHDIIRTWAFYTIVKAIYSHGKVPWKKIMISGFVLDPKGRKMSKSKGNVVDPREVLGKYPADALRYWAASTKLGEDVPFMEKELVAGKKTITKLWNASKFVFMNLEDFNSVQDVVFTKIDKWILHKLNVLLGLYRKSFDNYEYSKAMSALNDFFWKDFCDNYLEIVKHRLYQPEDKSLKESAQATLYIVLFEVIKMFSVFMPFVTEEIYQLFFRKMEENESVHLTALGEAVKEREDKEAFEAGELAVFIIGEARKFKSEKGVSLKEEIKECVVYCGEGERKKLDLVLADVKATAKINRFEFVEKEDEGRNAEGARKEIKVEFK